MSISNHQQDLDLLLSLEDRVLETPPASPSDDRMPKQMWEVDMSVFRDAVKDCLDYNTKSVDKSQKPKQAKSSNDILVDKFSGLRIQNPELSRVELSNRLSDIRFIRIPAIKDFLEGDTLSGCWATIGVLIEKGVPKTSSIGKPFAIWKIGCLDDNSVTVFMFGDAYEKNCEATIGTIFALFNCSVRKSGRGFTLSVFAAKHTLKLGTSADIGLCQGRDLIFCKAIINKRRRKYCDLHRKNGSKKNTSKKTELRGWNSKPAFKDYLKSEGIYVVKPSDEKANLTMPTKPVKLLSVECLKKALSTADKVTTNIHSQGIRFLSHVTGNVGSRATNEAAIIRHQQMNRAHNRPSQEPDAKKMKMEPRPGRGQETKQVGVKMIELDFASSDEEL